MNPLLYTYDPTKLQIEFNTIFNEPINLTSFDPIPVHIIFPFSSEFDQPVDLLPQTIKSIFFGLYSYYSHSFSKLPFRLDKLKIHKHKFDGLDNLPVGLNTMIIMRQNEYTGSLLNFLPLINFFSCVIYTSVKFLNLPTSIKILAFHCFTYTPIYLFFAGPLMPKIIYSQVMSPLVLISQNEKIQSYISQSVEIFENWIIDMIKN